MNEPHNELTPLLQAMVKGFDISDVRKACFDLSIDYDNLSGDNKNDKIINLLNHLKHHNRINDLVKYIRKNRPNIPLNDIYIENDKISIESKPDKNTLLKGSVSSSQQKMSKNNHLSSLILPSNEAYTNYLCKHIKKHKINKAQLIHYSGDMIRRVIERLLENGADVELLLQDPSNALNEYQLRKINLFRERASIDFKNSEKLKIRYYKEPASLRAAKFDDDFLSIGWYTYRSRSKEDSTPWLYGHNNPSINIYNNSAQTKIFVNFFNEVFQALWSTASSLEEV